jgi:hypothetical protein
VLGSDIGKYTGHPAEIIKLEFLATDPEVLGSILGASRFSERHWVWNGVHSAS